MNLSPSIPATVEIKHGRLFGLVAAIAVLAAAVTWILVAVAFDNGSSTARPSSVPADAIGNPLGPVSSAAPVVGSYFPTPQDLAQGGGGYTVGGIDVSPGGFLEPSP